MGVFEDQGLKIDGHEGEKDSVDMMKFNAEGSLVESKDVHPGRLRLWELDVLG